MDAASDSGSKQVGHGASALTACSPTRERIRPNREGLEQLRPDREARGTQWTSVALPPGDMSRGYVQGILLIRMLRTMITTGTRLSSGRLKTGNLAPS